MNRIIYSSTRVGWENAIFGISRQSRLDWLHWSGFCKKIYRKRHSQTHVKPDQEVKD